MINQFEKVKTSEKKIKYDLSLPYKNERKRPIFKSKNVSFPTNLYPVRTYYENDKVFVYCSDKYVHELNGSTFVKTDIEYSSKEPILLTVPNGEEKIVIKSPFGKDAIFLSGRLVISDGNKIYISKKIPVDTFNISEEDFSIIGLADSEGEIFGILASGENLLVLTKESLYKISRIDGDISVKRLSTISFSVQKNTFARCGNKGCFFSDNKLCVIENDKVNVRKTGLSGINILPVDKAGASSNCYLLHIYVGATTQTFLYDLGSEESHMISGSILGLSAKGGYVIANGLLKKFEYEYYESGVFGSMPDPEDMGTCKIKTVTEIEACVKGSATLRMTGDFGEKDFKLIEGCNVFRVGLTSKRFTFHKVYANVNFMLEEITLKYIVHEDSKNAI